MTAPIFVAFLALLVGLTERSSASPSLVEIYDNQAQERIRVSGICREQYLQAQYHQHNDELTGGPYRGESTEDSPIYRFMVSAKGVQAISPYVIAQTNGKFKCKRGEYELPKILGKDYAYINDRQVIWRLDLKELMDLCPGRRSCPTYTVRERLEIEPCLLEGVEVSCLSVYRQVGSSLVKRKVLGIEYPRRVAR